MGKLGNLIRKVAFKASGGILGTATGDKPGTGLTPVNTSTYSNPLSEGLNNFNKIADKGFTVSPMMFAGAAVLLLVAWLLFKGGGNKKS